MTVTAENAKSFINQTIDEIIAAANQRREELINTIEDISSDKMNRTIVINRDEVINTTNAIVIALKTHGNVATHSYTYSTDYIKRIPQDFEYESVLVFGFMHSLSMNVEDDDVPKDIICLCLQYFSLYTHLSPHKKQKYLEEKQSLNEFKNTIKDIIECEVEDVVVSNLHQRIDSKSIPCVLIDHSKNENVLKQKQRKRSLAIDPCNQIISVLKQRYDNDPHDETVVYLVWLLYEITALTSGFDIREPHICARRIYGLIEWRLGIIKHDSEDDDDTDDAYYNDHHHYYAAI